MKTDEHAEPGAEEPPDTKYTTGNTMCVRRISRLDVAEKVWRAVVQPHCVFDVWDFREAFWKACGSPAVHFVTAYQNEEPIALLPLQYKPNGSLEFFGGEFMEDNTCYTTPSAPYAATDMLLKELKAPLALAGMSSALQSTECHLDDYKYTLQLGAYSHYEQYLQERFSHKSCKKILRRVQKLEEKGVTVETGNPEDIATLMHLNRESFGKESWFADPLFCSAFQSLVHLPGIQSHLFTFRLKGGIVGVSLAAEAGGTYTCLLSGKNVIRLENIGTFIFLNNMQHALRTGAKTLDACMGNYNWKEVMHMERTPSFQLVQPSPLTIKLFPLSAPLVHASV